MYCAVSWFYPTSHSPVAENGGSESDDPLFDPDHPVDADEEKVMAREFIKALSRSNLTHAPVDICGVEKTEAAGIIGRLIKVNVRVRQFSG